MEKITWVENTHPNYNKFDNSQRMFPREISRDTRKFHDGIPGFEMTPLKSLRKMANFLGVGGIWVKDES